MGFASTLQTGFDKVVRVTGRPIEAKYYTIVMDNFYNEPNPDGGLLLSGTVSTSGVILDLDTTQGSSDSNLMEQGRLITGDKRLYVNGSLLLAGSDLKVKIVIGGDAYEPILPGAITPQGEGEAIYKKQYIRRLTTGSLYGE